MGNLFFDEPGVTYTAPFEPQFRPGMRVWYTGTMGHMSKWRSYTVVRCRVWDCFRWDTAEEIESAWKRGRYYVHLEGQHWSSGEHWDFDPEHLTTVEPRQPWFVRAWRRCCSGVKQFCRLRG